MAWVAGLVLSWLTACRDAGGPSGVDGFEVVRLTHRCPEGPMTKSGREIMEIFEAFDLTGTAWSAAQLTGCDAKTVARYVAVRDAGGDPLAKTCRPRLIDAFMPKVEELVDRSKGKIRADVAHRKLAAMGYRGSERSTRRAVAEVKAAWQAGRRRRYRPWSRSRGCGCSGTGGTGRGSAGGRPSCSLRGWPGRGSGW